MPNFELWQSCRKWAKWQTFWCSHPFRINFDSWNILVLFSTISESMHCCDHVLCVLACYVRILLSHKQKNHTNFSELKVLLLSGILTTRLYVAWSFCDLPYDTRAFTFRLSSRKFRVGLQASVCLYMILPPPSKVKFIKMYHHFVHINKFSFRDIQPAVP